MELICIVASFRSTQVLDDMRVSKRDERFIGLWPRRRTSRTARTCEEISMYDAQVTRVSGMKLPPFLSRDSRTVWH